MPELLLTILCSAVARDIFQGQIITSCVVVLFVCAFLIREWIMMNAHFANLVPPPPPPPPQHLDIVVGGRAIRLGGNQEVDPPQAQFAEMQAIINGFRAGGQAVLQQGPELIVEEEETPAEETDGQHLGWVKEEEEEEEWGGIRDVNEPVRNDWEDEEEGGPPFASTSRWAFDASFAAARARDTRFDVRSRAEELQGWDDEDEDEDEDEIGRAHV